MVPMNTCVIDPNFSLDEVQLASCYQYIDFTLKKKILLKKPDTPTPSTKKEMLLWLNRLSTLNA